MHGNEPDGATPIVGNDMLPGLLQALVESLKDDPKVAYYVCDAVRLLALGYQPEGEQAPGVVGVVLVSDGGQRLCCKWSGLHERQSRRWCGVGVANLGMADKLPKPAHRDWYHRQTACPCPTVPIPAYSL